MPSRRHVLLGLGTGAVSALAGCGCEAFPSSEVVLSADGLRETGTGWELDVTARASFVNPGDAVGIRGLDVAAYSRDRRVLDHETVGDVGWQDVPTDQRDDSGCAPAGSLGVGLTLATGAVPYFVGPRFLDAETARSFDPDRGSGFTRIVALQYGSDETPTRRPRPAGTPTASPAPTRSRPDRNGTTADPTAVDATPATTDATPTDAIQTTAEPTPTTTWQPTDPDSERYQRVDVRRLPWPRPFEQALVETPTFSSVEFLGASACAPGREPPALRQFGSGDGFDLSVRWSRPIPADSCQRPFLTDLGFDEGVLTMVVGLHEVPYVVCRECDRHPYELRATYRQPESADLTRVAIEHRTDGELVERTVVTP